jgi:ABC-type phosphate/phosphonate transport system substrate-binding protein
MKCPIANPNCPIKNGSKSPPCTEAGCTYSGGNPLAATAATCAIVGVIATGGYFIFKDKIDPLLGVKPSPTLATTAPTTTTLTPLPQQKLQTSSLAVAILTDAKDYKPLAEYLHSYFDGKVQVSIYGDSSISYTDVRNKIIRKEVDVAFTLSPMLSVAAKENGYIFVARMFPDKSNYYQAALFVSANSKIESIADLQSTNTIALGAFNSASSFYMPVYDLFGKSLQVTKGHRGREIKELVRNGKADVGAGALDAVKSDPNFKVIHISRPIPGSNVYLSPNLSEPDREKIIKALLNAPADIQKQANYGGGEEPDYTSFTQISIKAEGVLKCADFTKNPVNFYCPDEQAITSIIKGKVISSTNVDANTVKLTIASKDSSTYSVIVPRTIMNQVPNASNLVELQGKEIQISNITTKADEEKTFEINITQPDQITVLR